MKALVMLLLAVIIMGYMITALFAETRTLTTMIIITIKAPETQASQAPKGLEGLYNVALSQSQNQRLIKIEDPINTSTGLPRYTMTEKL